VSVFLSNPRIASDNSPISNACSFTRVALLLLAATFSVPAFAQHPYLWLDSNELVLIQNKVASNSPDWIALQAKCDALAGVGSVPYAVLRPHATNAGNSLTRGYVINPPHSPGIISTGFTGALWDTTINLLGACYQAVRTTDSVRAAAYLLEAHYMIQAFAQPWLKVVRQSDGLIRYAISTDNAGNDLLAGAQPKILMMTNVTPTSVKPAVGDVWTVSGATGCTSLNATWKVSAVIGWQIYFENPDGSPAAGLNANCTLYSVFQNNTGDDRFYMPAMAKAYDWLYGDSIYGGLSISYPDDVTLLQKTMWCWMVELSYNQYHGVSPGAVPEENFFYGSIWAIAAAYVAFNNDCSADNANCPNLGPLALGTSATVGNIGNTLNARMTEMVANYKLWMYGGGNGEGLQAYGYDSILRMIQAEYAMYTYQETSAGVYGADWRSSTSFNFSYLDDQLQYYMHFANPALLAEDENEYVYPIGTSYFTNYKGQWFPTEPAYIPLSQMVFISHAARGMGSSYAAQFLDWYNAVYAAEFAAAGVSVPQWSTGVYTAQPSLDGQFLWFDPEATIADWTTLPLFYRAWGGNYAVTRSSWGDANSTVVTMLGGPTVGCAGNGKTQFDSGAITIQTGSNRLLVYGLGEASRSADLLSASQWQAMDAERGTYGNKKNSIFWAGPNPSEIQNQGLGSRLSPPGQGFRTSWPGSMDRAEDRAGYTYLRAIHLEASNTKSSIDHLWHQALWTREMLFLRPKLVVVHDRTATLYPTDDRAMFWTFGRNIDQVSAGAPSGMTRYDASFNGIYRGAFWSVLPASADVTVVDHDNLHFLYRAEVRPSAIDHTADNWLAVFDAATSPEQVNTVSNIAATNADAVQFNDPNNSIVAFANVDPYATTGATVSWPVNGASVHYIAGLTPGASYGISVIGGTLTLSGSGSYPASAAGVLVYTNACQGLSVLQGLPTPWLRRAIACGCGAGCRKNIQ